MKIKQAITGVFAGKTDEVVPHLDVVLRREGVLISKTYPDGRFVSEVVSVTSGSGGNPWQSPIDLRVSPAPDVDPAAFALWLAQPQTAVAGQPAEPTQLAVGSQREMAALSAIIRQLWLDGIRQPGGSMDFPTSPMQAGFGFGGGPVSPQAPMPTFRPAQQAYVPPIAQAQAKTGSGWRGVMLGLLIGVGVIGSAYAAVNFYLKPKGPGIDMSTMSIDQVALLDNNPSALKNVQDGLLAAMTDGQAEASRSNTAGKIEKEHIDALRAMGLDPGKSMMNAMSCLADRK